MAAWQPDGSGVQDKETEAVSKMANYSGSSIKLRSAALSPK